MVAGFLRGASTRRTIAIDNPPSQGIKDVAVLISVEDAALLEELEDRIDVEDARKALAEGEFIPWDEAKKELEA